MKSAALLLTMLLTPGCFLTRTTIDSAPAREALTQLRPGETTATQVVALLGAPREVVQLGRRSAYRYEEVEQKRAGLFLLVVTFFNDDAQSDRTWVFFDEDDVLSHVGSTLLADDAEWAMPWFDKD